MLQETVWVAGGPWCGDDVLFSQAFLSMSSAKSVDLWKMLEVKPAFTGWGSARIRSGVVR